VLLCRKNLHTYVGDAIRAETDIFVGSPFGVMNVLLPLGSDACEVQI